MRCKLSHQVQGRCWFGQDVDTHKPVYVYLRKMPTQKEMNQYEGREVEYYLTTLGEFWEKDGETT